MSSTPATTYTRTAIALHWLAALGLFGAFAMGIYMSDLPMSPTRLKLFNWHKWAGVSLLVLAGIRLAWRLTHAAPAEAQGPLWQQRAARLTHAALYGLFFAVPLTGWAYSSASGFPVVWFGVLPLPDIAPVNRDLAETLKDVHKALNLSMAALVLIHVGAALKHQWIDRDGLLGRMWPATRPH
jgi:cytochrome b561